MSTLILNSPLGILRVIAGQLIHTDVDISGHSVGPVVDTPVGVIAVDSLTAGRVRTTIVDNHRR